MKSLNFSVLTDEMITCIMPCIVRKYEIICFFFILYRFLPGGSSGVAVSRLDQAAFCGPSGSDVHPFTADVFYSWLLTTFDEVCLPLIIVSYYYSPVFK